MEKRVKNIDWKNAKKLKADFNANINLFIAVINNVSKEYRYSLLKKKKIILVVSANLYENEYLSNIASSNFKCKLYWQVIFISRRYALFLLMKELNINNFTLNSNNFLKLSFLN